MMMFSDNNYKKILDENKIEAFIKCVYNTKNEHLKNLYEIHIKKEGNIDSIIKNLKKIEGIYDIKKRKYFEAITCENPFPPENDTWIKNGWCNNSALELLEANCAWSITTGKSSIVVGVADTDFAEAHEDLINQFVKISGPISDKHPHGTHVSGMVSAETNNNKGIAAIGYNTKIAGYRVYHYVADSVAYGSPYAAIMQAYTDKRKIINVSWSGTNLTRNEAKNITLSGTVLVVAAGNTPNATNHSNIADIPGVINVSGVDANNYHQPTNHAHNQWVDVCAMSTNVSTTIDPDWGTEYCFEHEHENFKKPN